MDKSAVSNFHPNLVMGMKEFEISDFIVELLQCLRNLEEQHEDEGSYIQLKKDQEQLKKDQEQLKKDQEQLKKDQGQLMKYQAFILKLSRQKEKTKADNLQYQKSLLKQGSRKNRF
jgi:hypothetical protein